MKQISTYLSILSLVLVGVLYYLFFTSPRSVKNTETKPAATGSSIFKIAYFDIDSLQSKYAYFRDVSAQVKAKEANMTSQLNVLQDSYQKRIKELQARGPNMSQSESEAAQREYTQMQQKYQQRQMAMEQDLKKQQVDLMTDVRNKIEDYLKEYNKQKGYAFILSYEPGFMLYYKDSIYDITNDIITGLNAEYEKNKTKK